MNDRSITRRTCLHRVGGVAVGLSLVPLVGCEENIVTPRSAGREVAFLSRPDLDPAEGGFYVKNGGEAGVPGWSMPNLDPAVPATCRLASVTGTARCSTASRQPPPARKARTSTASPMSSPNTTMNCSFRGKQASTLAVGRCSR